MTSVEVFTTYRGDAQRGQMPFLVRPAARPPQEPALVPGVGARARRRVVSAVRVLVKTREEPGTRRDRLREIVDDYPARATSHSLQEGDRAAFRLMPDREAVRLHRRFGIRSAARRRHRVTSASVRSISGGVAGIGEELGPASTADGTRLVASRGREQCEGRPRPSRRE